MELQYQFFLIYLGAVNLLAFVFCGWDKRAGYRSVGCWPSARWAAARPFSWV